MGNIFILAVRADKNGKKKGEKVYIVMRGKKQREERFKRREKAKKEIPKDVRSPIYLYSHVLVLISRLLIAKTLLTCAWTGRRGETARRQRGGGVALKCARNARENVKEEEEEQVEQEEEQKEQEGGGGGRVYVGYGEGHGSGDNERGVNHSGQTALLLTMRRRCESEKQTLYLRI